MEQEMKVTQPPSEWFKKKEEPINLYKNLLESNTDSNQKLALIIDGEGRKRIITKEIALKKSKYLAKEIINLSSPKVEKQLRIFAVLSASEASFYLMLASSFLGGNHCICFEDLSETAIASRIDIFQPHIIFGTGKIIKKLVDAKDKSTIGNIPVFDIMEILKIDKIPYSPIYESDFSPSAYNSDDILFTLFTSGSTGLPKAIRHTANRFTRYATTTSKHFFGLDKDSIIFTATDAGWINGHTYAFYGPLLCNSTIVISEDLSKLSNPDYLDFILINCKVTCFYASVTLLRAIRQSVLLKAKNSSLNKSFSLERIGSCGEPLANDVGEWAVKYFQPERKSIVNTYFQTETGGVLTAPRDEDVFNCDYSNVGKPSNFISIRVAKDLLNAKEREDEEIEPNELIVPNPWDGIFHSVISDRATKYFTKKGYYRLHDVGYYKDDGSLFIGGRSDDVINVAGHRVGSSEIENTVIQISGIFESCAVAIPDETMGSSIALFYSAKSEINEQIIREKINEVLSEYHQPQYTFLFNNLPKTKSGKIMRRAMRSIAEGGFLDPKSDYSTFANRDKFLKDVSKYLDFWITRKTGFYENMVFDLDLFCSSMCICNAKYLALPTLIIVILQTMENWQQEFREIRNINISLKNLDDLLFTCDIEMNSKKSICSISEDISISQLKDESCLYDTSFLCINVNHVSGQPTYISLIRKLESNFFRFGIKLTNNCTISEGQKIVTELIDSMQITSQDSVNSNTSNDNLITSTDSDFQLVPKIKIESVEGKERTVKFIRCNKCKVSLSSLNNERGGKAYLLPIIKPDGKKTYICDLCAAGW